MDLPTLHGFAPPIGTPLAGPDLARVAALLDSDDTRPDPDPTADPQSDRDLELEGYRVGTTAVGVFRVGGELLVATHEFFAGPHFDEQIARKLAEHNPTLAPHGITLTPEDLDPWDFDGELRTTAVHSGYAHAEQARHDGRLLLLGLVLASPELRWVAGWGAEVVVLARGHLVFYVLRTHSNGAVDLAWCEDPLDAHALYAEMVITLADELVPSDRRHRLGHVTPGLPRPVRAWLYYEAAHALSEQARRSAGIWLQRMVETGELRRGVRHAGSLSVAELARRLHTDPARLSRAISASYD